MAWGLLRSVATPPAIARKFSADRRFVPAYHFGNLAGLVTCFFQYVNLVSFFLGEMCVCHSCNFGVVVKGLVYYCIHLLNHSYSKLHFILESAVAIATKGQQPSVM